MLTTKHEPHRDINEYYEIQKLFSNSLLGYLLLWLTLWIFFQLKLSDNKFLRLLDFHKL